MRHPFESRLTRGPAPLGTIVVADDPTHLSGVFDVVASMHEQAAGLPVAGIGR